MKQKFFFNTNHLWRLLFVIALIGCKASVFADSYCDFTVDKIHYNYIDGADHEVEVTYLEYESGRYGGYYNNYTGSIKVPATVTYNSVTYKVTGVGRAAFIECYGLTSVTLPSTITYIGNNAFGDCNKLTSVNIPQSVKSIGSGAFSGCVSLNSISLPKTLTIIGDNTFSNCQQLYSIVIPDNVTSIGSNAFKGCSNLSSITIPSGVTSVGSDAFYGTSWLNNSSGLVYVGKVAYKYVGTMPAGTSITLKEGTVAITDAAFSGCSGLQAITIPEGVTSIGTSAFNNCTSLKSITIPESMKTMGGISSSPFYGCSALKDVTILCPNVGNYWFREVSAIENVSFGSSVTTIGNSSFYYCKGLTTITIPGNVKSIGSSAFNLCIGLKSITMENGVTNIEGSAFSSCSSLTTVNIPNSVESIGASAFYNCSSLTAVTISNSVESIGTSAFSSCSSLTAVTIPSGVKSIGGYAFADCTSLTTVNIPNSVTSIGNFAFVRTPWLNNQSDGLVYVGKVAYGYKGTMPNNASLVLADGTLGIADYAFCDSTKLASITIPNSVTSIGTYAFSGCSSLASITIPNSVTNIGNSAFRGCSGLTSITIPNSVTSIGEYAFANCQGLKAIVIPNTVTSIERSAFYNCSSLKSVSIPNSLTSIGERVFSNCTGLTSVAIPNSVTSIGTYAFSGCSGLTSVTIPNSVTSIGSYAFQDCSSLTSVTIPNSVTSIGSYAFSNCTSLASVMIEKGVQKIEGCAFKGCTALTSITIPSSITTIGGAAFADCNIRTVIAKMKQPISLLSTVFSYYSNYMYESYMNLATLYVPYGCKAAYESANIWKGFKEIIELEADISDYDNVIYADTIESLIINNQFELPIQLKNDVDVAGVSFNITLPEGMTLAKDEDSDLIYTLNGERAKSTKFSVYWAENADGSYGIRVMPTTTSTIVGNEGTLLTFTVQTKDDLEGGEYPIKLSSNSLTVKDGEGQLSTLDLDDVTTTITLIDVMPGDVNHDNRIDLTDAIMIVYSSLNVEQQGFLAKAADVNNDGRIDLTDAIMVVYKSLGVNQPNFSKRRSPKQTIATASTADVFVIDNITVPQGGTLDLPVGFAFNSGNTNIGFQLNIGLPEGVTTIKDEEGLPVYTKDETSCGKLTIYPTADNGFAAMPQTASASIKGTSGNLFTITLQADESLAVGTKLTANVTNAMFTMKDSQGVMHSVDVDDFTFTITIGEPADTRAILDENSTTAPEASEGEVDVEVKRTIKAGQWSTLCLPFAMTEEQLKAAFGENVQLADFTSYDADYDDDDNVTALTVNFDEMDVAEGLEANYPCLIKTEQDISEFQLTTTVEPDVENAVIEYDNGKTGRRREVFGSLIGTYTAQTTVPENCIFLSENKFWYSVGTTKMKAYRAYFNFVEILSNVNPAEVKFGFFIGGEATLIKDIVTNADKDAVYDLAGRKVNKPQQRGIYIINGKKTLIK